MAKIADLGTRIELVSMDLHFEEITIALYQQDRGDETVALVHSYSTKPGASERLDSVVGAMVILGGLERVSPDEHLVRFGCGSWHKPAARRAFIEACKIGAVEPVAARPMQAEIRRSGQQLRVENEGSGRYRVHADGVTEESASRAPAIARGLVKLAELDEGADETSVAFPCGQDHDAVIGLLLVRALNLRATLRQEQEASARGVLVSPSAQAQEQA